ncbi:MAG: glycosyl transferase [Acidobacteria bacterium RIFCSPHIGHO2_12_FULL_67_30]|nr:MAG: glycosyl transferase [Acidobacteria bacterium RIFCSPHIGHO2_02_FULL_67_57]OFV84513.1 MAG: glycosyl transferase [Acidobacteria bacterium RIFCSPHIGHO2_01_FULL_67_28]OFV88787.1 MAG: glycosyl transferase [Acidobacteria bacterium RIFCSPHIGHO2_12_FULL_67_30]
MADFFQTGVVATLHRLGTRRIEEIEDELVRFSRTSPMALVLPALYSEFETEAMTGILKELPKIPYLKQIVLSLGNADASQFADAKKRLYDVHKNVRVIWNEGERVQRLFRLLEEKRLAAGPAGKGRACWIAYGYVLASGQAKIIGLHDCDIVNYNRELLARLMHPIANPNVDFEFAKGFYARYTTKLHGRVTRLFVTPFVRTLKEIFGHLPFLVYLDSFRYPLAGEFAMDAELARVNRIPADWGLEVGVLAEVYRNCSLKRICQVDVADNYEHKHQSLSAEDAQKGLMRMTVDIAKTLFRMLAADGAVISEGALRTIQTKYVRTAEDTITRYHADAMINGLDFDRHEEEVAVQAFAQAIRLAAEDYLKDPLGAALIPNWNRVAAALPDFFGQLELAVEEDNAPVTTHA